MSTAAPPAPTQAPARSATKTAALLVAAAVGVLLLMLLLGLFVTRVLTHSGLGAADARVEVDLVRQRTPTLNRLTHYATLLAETVTIVAVAAVLFLVLRLTLQRWRESIFLAVWPGDRRVGGREPAACCAPESPYWPSPFRSG